MRILATGGAGYIGAHTVVALIDAGHDVLIADDFSASSPQAVGRVETITGTTVPLLARDLRDQEALEQFLAQHRPIDAVVHFAGLKSVAESVENPLRYYDTNIGSTLSVLRAMAAEGIKKFVFSSSATVYGDPVELPLTEDSPTGIDLANPYGKTKRIIEEILKDLTRSDAAFSATSLRYFNPVGAHASGLIGEDTHGMPNNLMPIVARAAHGKISSVSVYGDNYDTPDGTGLRDYIHVTDLAEGHVAAIEHSKPGFEVFNLGTGTPTSVLELIAMFSKASGRELPYIVAPRRIGDVASSYADASKAKRELGWEAKLTIEQACVDYWRWQTNNPHGYLGGLS